MAELSDPNEWLDKYGDALYRYAMARLRDTMVAEDLVQETFLAAVQARSRYAGKASEKTWLTSILKHKLIDHIRKQQRERPLHAEETAPEDVLDAAAFDGRGHWISDPGSWADPDQALENEEFWRVLEECLQGLPERLRQALTLREFEGLGTEEICQALAISSTNNTWVILSRARMRMRQCLDLKWFSRPPGEV